MKFIIGKSSSGKLDKIAHYLLDDANHGKEAVLLVPRQITFETDERLLDILGPRDNSKISVLSFTRFADKIIKGIKGIDKQPLPYGASVIMMSLAVEAVTDRLNIYKNPNIHTIEQLHSAVKQFKTNGISPGLMENYAIQLQGQASLSDKLHDLSLIYRSYDALISNSYYDSADMLSILFDILNETGYFEGKSVALYGFNSLTMQEMKILTLAQRDAERLYISVHSSKEEFLCGDESSSSACVNDTIRRLMMLAKKEGCTIFEKEYCDSPEKKDDLLHAETYILGGGFPFESKPENITIYNAEDSRDECDYVVKSIKELLCSGYCRARDITVAGVNTSRVERALEKYEVPYFRDKRQPLENSPLVIYLRSALEVAASGFITESVLKHLKSGLTELGDVQVMELENYAFLWNVGSDAWKNGFRANPNGFDKTFDERAKKKLAQLNSYREMIVVPIQNMQAAIQNSNVRDFCEFLFDFISDARVRFKAYCHKLEEDGNIELAIEQGQVWDIVIDCLDEIVNCCGDRFFDAKRFYDVFNLVISTKSLGKLPNHFDQVTLSSYDRLANHTPSVLFAIGFNEGVFPSYIIESSVWNSAERRALSDQFPGENIAPDDNQTVLYQNMLLSLVFQSVKNKLFVSYYSADESGKSVEPSDAVRILKQLFPLLNETYKKNTALSQIYSIESSFEFYARNFRSDSPEIVEIEQLLLASDEYHDRVLKLKDFDTPQVFEIKNKQLATALFKQNISVSASGLESYEKCPFAYFCNYGIGAKPRKRAEYNKLSLGNVVHYVLEMLVADYQQKRGDSILAVGTTEEIKSYTDGLLDSYLKEKMTAEEDEKTAEFLYAYRSASRVIDRSVLRLINELKNSYFEPYACEMPIGIGTDSLKPLRLPLENGYAEIHGKIDRVDVYDNNSELYIKIVDYKTGDKKFELSDVIEGLNVQMMLYLLSIYENGGEIFDFPLMPAGVLYDKQTGNELEKTERRDLPDDELWKKLLTVNRSGILLESQTVLSALSKDGDLSSYPVSDKKGWGYSLDEFILIGKKIKAIITKMGNSLHNGEIPVMPCKATTDSDLPCKYCDYADVCRVVSSGEKQERIIVKKKYEEIISILKDEFE